MRTLIYCSLILMIAAAAQAQPDQRTIRVTASGEVIIPADRVDFTIRINAEGSTPKEAYNLHKERESHLVSLLEKHRFTEENISYQPISMYSTRQGPEDDLRASTRQSVRLIVEDFDLYEELQMALIEEGFDNFHGDFSSSRVEEVKSESLKNAIANAQATAELLASETGMTLGDIVEIDNVNDRPYEGFQVRVSGQGTIAGGTIMDYPQTVTVTSTVTIRYSVKIAGNGG